MDTSPATSDQSTHPDTYSPTPKSCIKGQNKSCEPNNATKTKIQQTDTKETQEPTDPKHPRSHDQYTAGKIPTHADTMSSLAALRTISPSFIQRDSLTSPLSLNSASQVQALIPAPQITFTPRRIAPSPEQCEARARGDTSS